MGRQHDLALVAEISLSTTLANFINTHHFPPRTFLLTSYLPHSTLTHSHIPHFQRTTPSTLTEHQDQLYTKPPHSPVTHTRTNPIRPLLFYQSPLPIIQNACLIPLQWSTTASIPSLPRPAAQPSSSQNPQIGSSSYSLPLGFTNCTTSFRSTVCHSGSAAVFSDIGMTRSNPSYILPSDTSCHVNTDTSADSFILPVAGHRHLSPAAHFSGFTCTRSFRTDLSLSLPLPLSTRFLVADYHSLSDLKTVYARQNMTRIMSPIHFKSTTPPIPLGHQPRIRVPADSVTEEK